jgi:hypothetical protein
MVFNRSYLPLHTQQCRAVNLLLIEDWFGIRIVIYWAILICALIPFIAILSDSYKIPVIVSRKLFHILAVILFAPLHCRKRAHPILTLSYGAALMLLFAMELLRRFFISFLFSLFAFDLINYIYKICVLEVEISLPLY